MSSFSFRVKVVGSASAVLVASDKRLLRFFGGKSTAPLQINCVPSRMAVFFEAAFAAVKSMHVESFETRETDDSSSSGGDVPVCSL